MADRPKSSLPPRTEGALQAAEDDSALARRVFRPAQEFIHTEGASGRLLIVGAIIGLVLANSPLAADYTAFWQTELGVELGQFSFSHSLLEWVNSGLMAIFFFLVTLEVKREFVRGSLSSRDKAILPVVAALGGMLVPAALYVAINVAADGDPSGWGIAIATDIAFAVAIAALLKDRVGHHVLMFLLAFAIVDDIGAIAVIAIFYTGSIAVEPLLVAGALLVAIVVLRRMGLTSTTAYVGLGVMLWVAIFESGVHATIAGVLLALLTPADPSGSPHVRGTLQKLSDRYERALQEEDDMTARWAIGKMEAAVQRTEAPLDRLIRLVHPWSGFVVLPIFAFANAGIPLSMDGVSEALASPVAIGIFVALVLGKPLGILLASWLAVRTGFASLPTDARWGQVAGIGVLAGIGFTVSIFVAELAFVGTELVDTAKLAILAASLAAAAGGFLVLRVFARGSS
jgi:Na+:H+ antiporter, NhaA family